MREQQFRNKEIEEITFNKIKELTLKERFEQEPHYEYQCEHPDYPRWKRK